MRSSHHLSDSSSTTFFRDRPCPCAHSACCAAEVQQDIAEIEREEAEIAAELAVLEGEAAGQPQQAQQAVAELEQELQVRQGGVRAASP